MKAQNALPKLSAKSLAIAGLGLAVVVGLSMIIPKAFAGTGLSVTPNFPDTVTVGDTNVPVSLMIGNASTSDEGNVTLSSVTLVPSCGDTSPGCSTPDTGVFSVNATGTGHAGTSCAGDNFTIATSNVTTGQVSFTRTGGPLVLAFGASCQIDFTVNVVKVPSTDINSVQPGVQTAQLGAANGTSAKGNPASGTGTDFTTVNKASPSISTTLVPVGPVAIGANVHDSATLSGATANAGGTVTYHAYAGANTCSGTDLLNNQVTVTNGIVPDSSNISFASAGTYSFQAVYSGDVNNSGATSVCSTEQLVVNNFTASMTTAIHSGATDSGSPVVVTSVPAGSTVHDSATLTFSGPVPTGNVLFTFYTGASNCDSQAFSAGSVPINGSGVADPSSAQGPLAAGSYAFRAHWAGDSNYPNGATSDCEPLTVTQHQPSITTNLSASTVDVNTAVHDSATLTGATANAGGSVTYNVYAGTICSGTPVFTSTVTVINGSVPNSGNFTPTAAGTYNWQAVYSGDINNLGATSGCGTETLVVHQPAVEYCSPGYWKQSQHFDSYVTYSPNDSFFSVFGVNLFPGKTLLQVLSTGGGGLTAYGRAAVGALLNASALNSGLTPAQVIAKVQATAAAAPTSGNTNGYWGSANPEFTAAENCPLN